MYDNRFGRIVYLRFEAVIGSGPAPDVRSVMSEDGWGDTGGASFREAKPKAAALKTAALRLKLKPGTANMAAVWLKT